MTTVKTKLNFAMGIFKEAMKVWFVKMKFLNVVKVMMVMEVTLHLVV